MGVTCYGQNNGTLSITKNVNSGLFSFYYMMLYGNELSLKINGQEMVFGVDDEYEEWVLFQQYLEAGSYVFEWSFVGTSSWSGYKVYIDVVSFP